MTNQDQDPTTGKFVKGNKASPGRPAKEREARYYDILMTAVTFEKWQKIVEKAADQAVKGDQAARKWLADYLVGAPIHRNEVTGKDGGKIEVSVESEQLIRRLLPELANSGASETVGDPDPE